MDFPMLLHNGFVFRKHEDVTVFVHPKARKKTPQRGQKNRFKSQVINW